MRCATALLMPSTRSRSEMTARLLAPRTNARNLVEGRAADRLHPLGAVCADGEAVRLVAQPLQVIENRILRIEAEGFAAGTEETLAPGVAIGSLGDAGEREIGNAEIGQHLLRR